MLNSTIEKRISFEAGHRLMDYEGKCKNLHGHNYTIILGLRGNINKTGFIRDFADVKNQVKDFVEKLDHAMILNAKDDFWIKTLQERGQKLYIMNYNPTAENMSYHFYHVIKEIIPELAYIIVEETPTGRARYES